jgi:hypothetical protein
MIKTVKSFSISIYVGFKNRSTGEEKCIDDAEKVCSEYCNIVGQCVTITPTKYIYTNGSENGCIIGLSNYPRFPSSEKELLGHAIALASLLQIAYKQMKVSIVIPEQTTMLSSEE